MLWLAHARAHAEYKRPLRTGVFCNSLGYGRAGLKVHVSHPHAAAAGHGRRLLVFGDVGHQCGQGATAGDVFCRKCGTKLK